MKCVRLAALGLGIAATIGVHHAMADDPVKHESTATSSATVTVASDGTVNMTARNARLIPYTLFNTSGGNPTVFPRLATVTTDVRKRSDAEGEDPSSSVSVTIDDLSGTQPRRLADSPTPGLAATWLASATLRRQYSAVAVRPTGTSCARPKRQGFSSGRRAQVSWAVWLGQICQMPDRR